jgi:hypothetical protein
MQISCYHKMNAPFGAIIQTSYICINKPNYAYSISALPVPLLRSLDMAFIVLYNNYKLSGFIAEPESLCDGGGPAGDRSM